MTLDDLIEHLASISPVYEAAARFPAALVREALVSGLASEWEDSPFGPAVRMWALTMARLWACAWAAIASAATAAAP